MRELKDHKVNPANDKLTVAAVDLPGIGGAPHHYMISWDNGETGGSVEFTFQNGPIAEVGVNGVTQEALLSILCDRLRGFQSGQYACRENAIALSKLEEAQMWLQKRTRDRMARGVEGTHKV